MSYLRAQTPSLLHVVLRIKNTFTFFLINFVCASHNSLDNFYFHVASLLTLLCGGAVLGFFSRQFVDALIWFFFELSIALFKQPTRGCVYSLGGWSLDKCHILKGNLFILFPLAWLFKLNHTHKALKKIYTAVRWNNKCHACRPQIWLGTRKVPSNRPCTHHSVYRNMDDMFTKRSPSSGRFQQR